MGFHGDAWHCDLGVRLLGHGNPLNVFVEWCEAHSHWNLEQWKRVLWSDESHFTFWQSNWVWWVQGECYLSQSIVPTESLVDARRMLPVPKHSANCKVWWMQGECYLSQSIVPTVQFGGCKENVTCPKA
jgi:hypothetical protein